MRVGGHTQFGARGGRALVAVILLAAGLAVACVPPWTSPPASASVEAALLDLVRDWPADGAVTILGFRDADGASSAQTEALDEALLSAAVRAGRQVRADAGVAGGSGAVPASDNTGLWPPGWRAQPGPWVVSGQLRLDPPWAYLRLAVAGTAAGRLWRDARTRVAAADLERLAQARLARLSRDAAELAADLQVEMHVVVRRDEGGFPQRVDWEEGGALDEGDRVQLRLRVDQDCDMFIFLYDSGGQTQVLLDDSVFGGRWIYVPGENGWRTLDQGDEVYTLYVIAARRIEEDKSSLWERLSVLQQGNRVEKFRGLDLMDAAVAEFLRRTVTDSVVVGRGESGVRAGDSQRFTYEDGAVFDSAGLRIGGSYVARARSAEVRFR